MSEHTRRRRKRKRRNLRGKEENGLVTLTVSADGAHTNLRRSNKNHMYIRPESPAGARVKHSITGTWGPEDDKCGPQESVIVSGIKGPPCLWRKNRQAMESWRERRDGALKD